jgi:hypothetical protein
VTSSAGNGTMTMPSVETASGKLDEVAIALGDGLPAAFAVATRAADAPIASDALNTNAAIRRARRGVASGLTSSLTAATAVPFFARGLRAHAPRGAAPARSQAVRSASRS